MKKKHFYWSIILTFLLTSLVFLSAISFIFYKALDKYNDTRLNPLQISSAKIDSTKIYNMVLLGDSHAQYWRKNSETTLNIGVTGQTSEQIKSKFQILKNQIHPKIDTLIISMGANDVKSVATNPETKNLIVKNCLENIQYIVKENKERCKVMYLMTIPPDFKVSFPYNFINYDATSSAKTEINAGIRRIAKQNRIKLIDTFEIFKNENPEKYSIDGVHMNKEACQKLDALIK